MRFEEMAQDLVQATSRLVSNRIINIMDTNGVIIASTEKHRIGTVHQGACEVIRTGHAVAIEKSDLDHYAGAKEGYNMPIYSEKRIIAVVGIFGNPSEVYDTANLLAAYTSQFIQQNAVAMQQQAADELRTKYLHMLVSLSTSNNEMLSSLGEALCICQRFPSRAFIVRLASSKNTLQEFQVLSRIIDELKYQQLISGESDVWGIIDSRLTIIKSDISKYNNKFSDRICDAIESCTHIPFQLCVGGMCSGIRDIETSYKEALSLCDSTITGVSDIADANCKFQSVIASVCVREAHLAQSLYRRLVLAFGEKDLPVFLSTAECYYNAQGSVNQAAEIMHIHKNTLQYRLHRVWDILELGECSAFIKEFFVRLCIEYHHKI